MKDLCRSLLVAAAYAADTQSAKASRRLCPASRWLPPPLPAKILEGQGSVHFPITTKSPEAQKFFDQGVAQMHSFWAREAERSFLQAAQLDPEAPMPHWGIAMVAAGDYRPRFQMDGDPKQRPVIASREGCSAARARAVQCSGQSDRSREDVHRLDRCATG